MESLPILLKNRHAKDLPPIIACVLFVTWGVWVWKREPYAGALIVAFFGLFAIVGIIGLHPTNSRLSLEAGGFVFAKFFERRFVPWACVETFRVVGGHVCWNYRREFRGNPMPRLPAFISDVDGVFTDSYGMTAQELCRLMTEVHKAVGVSWGEPANLGTRVSGAQRYPSQQRKEIQE